MVVFIPADRLKRRDNYCRFVITRGKIRFVVAIITLSLSFSHSRTVNDVMSCIFGKKEKWNKNETDRKSYCTVIVVAIKNMTRYCRPPERTVTRRRRPHCALSTLAQDNDAIHAPWCSNCSTWTDEAHRSRGTNRVCGRAPETTGTDNANFSHNHVAVLRAMARSTAGAVIAGFRMFPNRFPLLRRVLVNY